MSRRARPCSSRWPIRPRRAPRRSRGAIRNHGAAGHFARAATLSVAALERYPEDAEARALAERTLSEVRERIGALHVTCPEACAVTLDGRPVGRGAAVHLFVEPGEHRVVASFADGGEAARAVEIEAGTSTDLHLALAAPEPPAPAPAPVAPPAPPAAPPARHRARALRRGARAHRLRPRAHHVVGRRDPRGARRVRDGADPRALRERRDARVADQRPPHRGAGLRSGDRDRRAVHRLRGGALVAPRPHAGGFLAVLRGTFGEATP
ncbi:MAG: hypothetical protein M5U28_44795 [Sandaracinaceae bacterium]|nr:hypothetical protein [Sandaracinaceae bacterium]